VSWTSTTSYSWSPPPRPPRVMTSRTELIQIGIAYAVLTVDMLLILSANSFLGRGGTGAFSPVTVGTVAIAAGAALTGFVAHELAHKVTAQRHGFWAEFRLSPFGLILSLVTAAVGFLFAAPGATLVAGIGEHDAGNWGRTSLAGPMSNLAFATAFYGASIGASYALPAWVGPLLFLAFINAWFGTFNLVPIGPLDGAKVLRWSTAVWVLALVGTAAATVVSYLAYFGGAGPALGL